MSKLKRFLSKLKAVSQKDIGSLFLFLIAILPSKFLRLRHPDMWLICEYGKIKGES